MNELEFETLLDKAFPAWNREESPNRGIQKVKLTGSGFLRDLDEQKANEIISLMKDQFPRDAAFCRAVVGYRLENWTGTGQWSDLYYIYFASQEWTPLKEDEPPLYDLDAWHNSISNSEP